MYKYRKNGKLSKRVFDTYEQARSFIRKMIRNKWGHIKYSNKENSNPLLIDFGYTIQKV